MQIVIITGGSRGIGAATALECARRGLGVILTYNSHQAGAAEVVRRITDGGGKAAALKLDVGSMAGFADFRLVVEQTLSTPALPRVSLSPAWRRTPRSREGWKC